MIDSFHSREGVAEQHRCEIMGGGAPRLTSVDFRRFQQLIYEEAGIYLPPVKKPLVAGRLAKRLRTLRLQSFGTYLELVKRDEAERTHMLDCITTNETHFFRDRRHFRFLEEEVYPRWQAEAEAGKRARAIRVWSAACSTGEEPFSLAMSLLHYFGKPWKIEITGTDISTRVLAHCNSRLFPIERAGEIPKHYLKRFMLKGTGLNSQYMKAGEEICSLVRFERMNLIDDDYSVPGSFDLIFCCNVLIYFNTESKRHVVERLARKLADDGFMFFGHAESLSGVTGLLRSVEPTIYRHAVAQ